MVVTVMDADAMVKYPRIGHTTRIQIEAADAILLNKVDLVSASELKAIEEKLRQINDAAEIFLTQRCQLDTDFVWYRSIRGFKRHLSIFTSRNLNRSYTQRMPPSIASVLRNLSIAWVQA